jgi:para-aminobenzoate synthetase component 1
LLSDPYLTLTTRGQTTEICSVDSQEFSSADPFAILTQYLAQHQEESADLPFTGGAAGYFAYDLGHRIESLPDTTVTDISMPEMAIGFYDAALVVDHEIRQCWLICGERQQASNPFWELMSGLAAPGQEPAVAVEREFRTTSEVQADISQEEYAHGFERIQHYIQEGDCYQVNYTQRFSAGFEGDSWAAYRTLRNINPAPFSAYMKIPQGAILSSSPERFLKLDRGRVETKPIKGTRPRMDDPAADLAMIEELWNSLKDRAENVMIVDLLRNDLGKHCIPGSVRVPELFAIESFATVHHLVSTVTGQLDPQHSVVDLLRGGFPGGSITGAPKLRAMEIIEELEVHKRSIYCGSLGYIGFDGQMDTNIAIRTLLVNEGKMHCWAGGGIVRDSVMAEEYQECLDKARAMLELYRLSRSDEACG